MRRRIALLSDTHSDLPSNILPYLEAVDEIWHAGDIGNLTVTNTLKSIRPLRAVWGNIDGTEIRMEFPEYDYFELCGVKVMILHIAGRPGKYSKQALKLLQTYPIDLFVCGHSHNLLVQRDKHFNLLWLNPGACGLKGFHSIRTMLRFTLENGKVSELEVIELGKRGAVHNL